MKNEFLWAAERDLSDIERLKYVWQMRMGGVSFGMEWMRQKDAEKAHKLVWC